MGEEGEREGGMVKREGGRGRERERERDYHINPFHINMHYMYV